MNKFKKLLHSPKTKVFLLLLLLIISALFLISRYLLTFLNKEMDWQWYDNTTPHGIQVTRTTDTHQLLFRKVYPLEQAVIFTSLTLDNKYNLFTIFKSSCDPQKTYTATVTEQQNQNTFPLTCMDGKELSFRQVMLKVHPLTINFENKSLTYTPKNWPLNFLKKDQFIQKHKHYFCTKKHFQACEYEWSRD
jgi:hypothetical protein